MAVVYYYSPGDSTSVGEGMCATECSVVYTRVIISDVITSDVSQCVVVADL